MIDIQKTAFLYENTQMGKNGYLEYGWSNNTFEILVQINFQLVRNNNNWYTLKEKINQLLYNLKNNIILNYYSNECKYCLELFYRMIAYTRDYEKGKGECKLSYMMINILYDYYPQLACFALSSFVTSFNKNTLPYGSWKDIKYFCRYCLDNKRDIKHPLIIHAIRLINNQLIVDINNINNNNPISLVAKWIPREKSSFGILFNELAYNYFPDIIKSASNAGSLTLAKLKCKTNYRKICSYLNKKLNTPEINMCNNSWKEINFHNISLITLIKNYDAFSNMGVNVDRVITSNNLKTFITNKNIDKIVNKKKIDTLLILKKIGRKKCNDTNEDFHNEDFQCKLFNLLWYSNNININNLYNYIPIIDNSFEMSGDPLYAAASIALSIAEKSKLGKRVVKVSNKAEWVNLEHCDNLTSMMNKININTDNTNANLIEAFTLILNGIIKSKMDVDNITNMVLVVMTGMHMENSMDTKIKKAFFKEIEELFHNEGMKIYKKPLKIPHIIFWNLTSTNGFPVASYYPNFSMLSGYNINLLNNIPLKNNKSGMIGYDNTPFSCMQKILLNKRYDVLGYFIKNYENN